MKVIVKPNKTSEDILHDGEVHSYVTGNRYTFEILHARYYHYSRAKSKKITDSSGIEIDRACEWHIKFHNFLPDFFCRSDHKMAKRMAIVVATAYERGLEKNSEGNTNAR